MTVIGYQRSRFTAKDTGEVIEGYNLYLTETRENVEGAACERVFLSAKKLGGYVPVLNDELELVYNRFGRVDRVIVE